MNDVVPGLIVAAVTAVAVAAIFYLSNRAKTRKIEALRAHCAQRGWKYSQDSGPLRHGLRIEGAGWAFAAISDSGGREAAPGSSDWSHSSRWAAIGEDPGRGTFILGLNPGGMRNLSLMPPALLSRFLGDEIAGLRPYSPGPRLEERFVLLAREEPPAMGFLEARTEELLLAWPASLPLVIRSSPARLELQVAGKRLERPEDVDRLIELGESLAVR